MPDIRIRKELLETLFALGKSQHPNEFLAILKEKDGIIEELELAPGTISGNTSASFDHFMMPLDTNTAGSGFEILPEDWQISYHNRSAIQRRHMEMLQGKR